MTDWTVEVALAKHPDQPWATFRGKSDTVQVAGEIARGPQGPYIARIEMTSDHPRGVNTLTLRGFPMGSLVSKALAEAARLADRTPAPTVAHKPAKRCSCGCLAHRQSTATARRAVMTPAFLQEVALAYIDECAAGTSGVLRRMAERFGRPEQTIRTWLGKARQEGWLGPGAKGRAGAEPGPKLIARETS